MADTYHDIEAEIPRLRRYARALTRDVVSADDLVQDCLTRALGKLHLWQEGSDLRAWLFTILHNQYVNHIRRAVREGAAVTLNETEPMLSRTPQQGISPKSIAPSGQAGCRFEGKRAVQWAGPVLFLRCQP